MSSKANLGPDERKKTHLLVVEDEPTIRGLFAALLTSAGFTVAQAEDGFAALEQVRRRRPALILSDLNMPRMTGFELLSVVRRRFPAINVIAMSGAFTGDEVPAGVAADAFYEKSGRHISTLVHVIEELLIQARALALAEAGEDDPAVALWVTRHSSPAENSYILLNCPECLRSFPHYIGDHTTMRLRETSCVFCESSIAYALLDPTTTQHQGYAPLPVTP